MGQEVETEKRAKVEVEKEMKNLGQKLDMGNIENAELGREMEKLRQEVDTWQREKGKG